MGHIQDLVIEVNTNMGMSHNHLPPDRINNKNTVTLGVFLPSTHNLNPLSIRQTQTEGHSTKHLAPCLQNVEAERTKEDADRSG